VSARPESVLRPEYGPSLPQLLRARFGIPTRVVSTAALVLVAGAIAFVLFGRGGGEVHLVHRTPAPVFNLRYANVLHRSPARPGVLLELVGRRGGLFLQSMTVRPLRLPAYRGAVSGQLPILAVQRAAVIRRAYPGFTVLDEGKARINDAPGYQIGFQAKRGKRTVYGKEILLLPDEPGARDGVAITLLQTHAAGAHAVDDVGTAGAIKKPFRSFRFGTEAK
jgi:hypothetical protein